MLLKGILFPHILWSIIL